MPDELTERLTNRIRSIVQTQKEGLGSSFGQIFDSADERVEFKRRFHNLKTFLRDHCAEMVSIGPASGMDYRWTSLIYDDEEVRGALDGHDIWQAFTNTSSPKSLYLDVTRMVLVTSDKVVEGSVSLVKLSRDEQRAMARSFIETLDEPLASGLGQILDQESYWTPWVRALNQPGNQAINRAWRRFRLEKIKEALKRRMLDRGVADADANLLSNLISDHSTSRPKATEKHWQPKATEKHWQPKERIDRRLPQWGTVNPAGTPNQLVVEIINRMSEAELMQLWVPIHVVIQIARENTGK